MTEMCQQVAEADRLLGPLDDLQHPEDLRDVIAGAARQTEDHLLSPLVALHPHST